MNNATNWTAFDIAKQATISEVTGAAYSSLSKWKSSRGHRVRLLELATALEFHTEEERNALINDPEVDLQSLLNKLGFAKTSITDFTLLIGESRRTTYSWWTDQGTSKKRLLLLLVEGLLCALAIAKCPNMDSLMLITDSEIKESEHVEIPSETVERIAFSAFKMSLIKQG
ncbi:hypothetical protein [Psychromonas sp. SP041]|uniref:hypothetical protein n=1 Tax=Psychromonas sp. SP041 TaxID=1365007 RepID=UPI0003FB6120|nr:hypothetical protein [Psychromonas sp. SP041]